MRSRVQALSIPELTELERSAEDLRDAKLGGTDYLLEQLRYKNPPTLTGSDVTHVDLERRSRDLLDVLHKTQDAIAALKVFLSH